MSFSFYEPWVNTAHVNDILTQRAMNNAFEFTFMPELDPSPHPPSLFSSFPPPHPALFSPPSSSSSLHYSSSPELNLISPLHAPPSLSPLLLSPPTPLSDSREKMVRDQTRRFQKLKIYCICVSHPGLAQVAAHWYIFFIIMGSGIGTDRRRYFCKSDWVQRLSFCFTDWFSTDQWVEIR